MKIKIGIFIAAALVISIVAQYAVNGGDEQKKTELQGNWKVIKSNDDELKLIKFEGNKFTVQFADRVFTGTFELRKFDSPKGIDMLIKKTPKAEYEGKTALGIYKIDGETLTWCASKPGRKRRPPEFQEVLGDAKLVLATLKRVKK